MVVYFAGRSGGRNDGTDGGDEENGAAGLHGVDLAARCDGARPAQRGDTTQTVGVYPESLRDRLLDSFALTGVQRMVPLKGADAMAIFPEMHNLRPGMPHGGIEPLRRSVRRVIDHRALADVVPLVQAAE